MPKEVYHAYGYVKKAAAVVNTRAGRLPAWKGELIQRVCDEVISGALDSEFPLDVWQTGSGTTSNMNVQRGARRTGPPKSWAGRPHRQGQASPSQRPREHGSDRRNDTFPTAMHIAAYTMAMNKTIPAIRRLHDAAKTKSDQWAEIVKIGRTHLEDATPLTVGQEWSGYVGALADSQAELAHATKRLLAVSSCRWPSAPLWPLPWRSSSGARRKRRRPRRRWVRRWTGLDRARALVAERNQCDPATQNQYRHVVLTEKNPSVSLQVRATLTDHLVCWSHAVSSRSGTQVCRAAAH